MTDIHHTCRCIRRTFSFAEWIAYVREIGYDSSKVVHTSPAGFNFNLWDCCINYNIPVKFSNRYCDVEIRTAQSDNGRWNYGFSSTIAYGWSSSPTNFIDDPTDGYATETQAILAALEIIRGNAVKSLSICERDIKQYPDDVRRAGMASNRTLIPHLKDFIRKIDEERRRLTFVQQTLF